MAVNHRVRFKTDSGEISGIKTTNTIYHGVSANSWLTHIGFGSSSDRKYMTKSGPHQLLEPCKSYVTERGRLSSSLFGRRFQEVGLQDINCGSVLQGKQILPGNNAVFSGQLSSKRKNVCSRSGSFVGTTMRYPEWDRSDARLSFCPRSARELNEKYGNQRPYTVGRLSRDCHLINTRRFQQPIEKEETFITIKQFLEPHKKEECVNNNDNSLPASDTNIIQLRKSLQNTLQDLPPGLHSHLNKKFNNTPGKSSPPNSSTPDSPTKPQSILRKSTTGSLKPLIYDDVPESEKVSENICPHKNSNKNCFTAFLASENYVKDNKVMENNVIPPRNKNKSRSSSVTSPQNTE